MRHLTALLLVFLVFASASAQRKTKTPPLGRSTGAATFRPPSAEKLREFVDPNGNFTAVFTGTPHLTEELHNGSQMLGFVAVEPGFEETALVVTVPVDISPEQAYDVFRKAMNRPPRTKLIAERPAEIDGLRCVEFVADDRGKRVIARMCVSGVRLFQFSAAVGNWASIQKSPASVKAFEDETARFFASVRIKQPVAEETPIAILGEWRGNLYINEYLGFSWPVDEKYTIIDPLELDGFKDQAKAGFRYPDEELREQIETAMKSELLIGGFKLANAGTTTPVVAITVRKISRGWTLDEVARVSAEVMAGLDGVRHVGEVKTREIGGEKGRSWTLDREIKSIRLYQTAYVFIRKGYGVSVVSTAFSEDQAKEFDAVIDRIRWNPSKEGR